MTLSLGLRYELNTPIQTYAGFASMLAADSETLIPTSFPDEGFKFHDPNYKDIAPRLGATYRIGNKTVLRAGYGIYYNPNQMNSFTFLTNNPPLAPVSTFSSDPNNPTLSFSNPSICARCFSAVLRTLMSRIAAVTSMPSALSERAQHDLDRKLAAVLAPPDELDAGADLLRQRVLGRAQVRRRSAARRSLPG